MMCHIMYLTYSLLSLSLVSLHFKLQLVHQILKSVHILLVLLSLYRYKITQYVKKNRK